MNYKPGYCYSFRFGVYFPRVGGCVLGRHPQKWLVQLLVPLWYQTLLCSFGLWPMSSSKAETVIF